MKLLLAFKRIFSFFTLWGFISPSVCLTRLQKKQIKILIFKEDSRYVKQFEQKLSSVLGSGHVVTFASGRMAFFAILKSVGIKEGDEVILTGFTCSVMVNAVKRCGAIPVFADIDADTLGTSPDSVERCITSSTKMIVAQHSFGIPCEIDKIQKIAKENCLFLVEDCALSFLSSYKGIILGNWGDAAIFSLDHTKPINTFIGGFAYTNNKDLFNKIHGIYRNSGSLSSGHCQKIFSQYLKENKIERISHKLFILDQYYKYFIKKVFPKRIHSPYLLCDAFAEVKENSYYPYPAKLPSFLAYIGMLVLEKYISGISEKKDFLKLLIEEFQASDIIIPKKYFDTSADIVPLRFCFLCNNQEEVKKLRSFTDGWIWFTVPIVATTDSLSSFGYYKNDCPVAEKVGQIIMNLPIPERNQDKNKLIFQFKKYLYV